MSSVGLGTGLHTFLLFLGPHIIRVAITAGECDSTDFDTSIEWFHGYNLLKIINYSKDSFQCKINPLTQGASFWQILQKVEWSCLLWGAGTAIGELPPYFVARQARLSGEKISELNEINDSDSANNKNKNSLMSRIKKKIYDYVQNFGFFAILIFASIPNPLFDLAGLTCGHFLIPFWTFFGATLIGKSLIKSNIQGMFYIAIFNRVTLEYISSFIDNYIPIFKGTLTEILNSSSEFAIKSCLNKDLYSTIETCSTCCDNMLKDKSHQQKCYEKCKMSINNVLEPASSSSWLSSLWEIFITLMILYFLVSIINSMVKESEASKYQRILSNMSENIKDINSISPLLTVSPKQSNENGNNSGSVNIIINDSAYRRVKTPGTNSTINNNTISPSDINT